MKKKWKFDQGERKRENNATLKIFLIDEVRARTFCLQAAAVSRYWRGGNSPQPRPRQVESFVYRYSHTSSGEDRLLCLKGTNFFSHRRREKNRATKRCRQLDIKTRNSIVQEGAGSAVWLPF